VVVGLFAHLGAANRRIIPARRQDQPLQPSRTTV
jgi:hypothetical protein